MDRFLPCMFVRRLSLVVLVSSACLFVGACSSMSGDDEPWSTQYVGPPNDVWDAIHMVLFDLDYEVEEENRNDGTIRATRDAGDSGAGAVLQIDQIMRGDMVSVYVKVVALEGHPAMSRDQQGVLATDFLTPLKGILYP